MIRYEDWTEEGQISQWPKKIFDRYRESQLKTIKNDKQVWKNIKKWAVQDVPNLLPYDWQVGF